MEKIDLNNKTIIISRTDSIGDVILTLPLAVFLKTEFPRCKIVFLAKKYTQAIVSACSAVDVFVDKDNIADDLVGNLKKLEADAIIHVFPNKSIAKAAKTARIPLRIGTSHRFFHLFTCNKKVDFTRKKSLLHEAQLNFKLLNGLNMNVLPDLNDLNNYVIFDKIGDLPENLSSLLKTGRRNVILHPGSKGSAREWGLDNFEELENLLIQNDFHVFLTGTEAEGCVFREKLVQNIDKITDLSGKMNLNELVSFISNCDALVAASTGPLHIAGISGILAVGLFPPIRPMHPGRWRPLGKNVRVFVADKECSQCRKSGICSCMKQIQPSAVVGCLIDNLKK